MRRLERYRLPHTYQTYNILSNPLLDVTKEKFSIDHIDHKLSYFR
jgi:hypothetical protein